MDWFQIIFWCIAASVILSALITITMCLCPEIYPCERFQNRRFSCGHSSDWCVPYYYRRNFNQQPIYVTVTVPGGSGPVQQNYLQQQQAMPTQLINQYSRNPGKQGAVYSTVQQPPLYQPTMMPTSQQLPYNPNFS